MQIARFLAGHGKGHLEENWTDLISQESSQGYASSQENDEEDRSVSTDSLKSFIVSDDDESYIDPEETPILTKRKLECLGSDLKAPNNLKKRKIDSCVFSKEVFNILPQKMPYQIIGRKDEIEELVVKIESGICPILTGPDFIGKKTIMRGVAEKVSEKGIQVILVDCVLLMAEIINKNKQNANTDFRKDIEVLLKLKPKTLFYFRDLDYLLEDENSKIYFEALVSEPIRFSASFSVRENRHTLRKLMVDLKRFRFEEYKIREPVLSAQVSILKSRCDRKIKHPIDKKFAEKVLDLTRKYFVNEAVIHKAFSLIKETSHTLQKADEISLEEIAKKVSKEVCIPSEILLSEGNQYFEEMEKRLNQRIRFQNHAIERICELVRIAKSPLAPKEGPRLVALLLGPTGVGKTETAKALAEELFHSRDAFIRIDMSEFKEKESISGLIGARPGYKGYGKSGGLVNQVRKNPNCVILFDEIEEADPAVISLLLQILSDGRLSDGNCETVDFSKTYILFTSNKGSEALLKEGKKQDLNLSSEILSSLKEVFEDKVFNRFRDIIPFSCITEGDKKELAEHLLKKLSTATLKLSWDESVTDYLSCLPCNLKLGVREFDRLIDKNITKAIIRESKRRQKEFEGQIHLSYFNKKILIKEVSNTKLKK